MIENLLRSKSAVILYAGRSVLQIVPGKLVAYRHRKPRPLVFASVGPLVTVRF